MNMSADGHRQRWIVLLSGTSCSGKTAVSRALQERLSGPARPFLHIEADRFVPHLPDVWSRDDNRLAALLGRALHRAIDRFADDFDLIVDGVLPYRRPAGVADALAVFRRSRFCYVAVHCAVDILERRERRRPDRVAGWARQQQADLHTGASYDIEVDTSELSAAENAAQIARYLVARDASLGPPPAAVDQ